MSDPHDNLYTRLKPSPLGGVGVFAIRDIPKDTRVFQGDESDAVEIKSDFVEALPAEIRKMYTDFCVFKKDTGTMVCPKDFNAMPISWFLNHSEAAANVASDAQYEFYALRDIAAGEELLSNYATYSDLPPGEERFDA